MPPEKLIIVRHGAFDGYDDPPLSEEGVKQVHTVADALGDISNAVIHTSPAKRTQQTANILAEQFSIQTSDIHTQNLLEDGTQKSQIPTLLGSLEHDIGENSPDRDAVILVTHLLISEDIPVALFPDNSEIRILTLMEDLNPGEAYIINPQEQSMVRVP